MGTDRGGGQKHYLLLICNLIFYKFNARGTIQIVFKTFDKEKVKRNKNM